LPVLSILPFSLSKNIYLYKSQRNNIHSIIFYFNLDILTKSVHKTCIFLSQEFSITLSFSDILPLLLSIMAATLTAILINVPKIYQIVSLFPLGKSYFYAARGCPRIYGGPKRHLCILGRPLAAQIILGRSKAAKKLLFPNGKKENFFKKLVEFGYLAATFITLRVTDFQNTTANVDKN